MNDLPSEPGTDAGPFGRPLFNDPSARALARVGVVDVGSNSVRLVVFDGAARSPAYFYNEKIMCALGAGLSETGILSPEGRRRALAALRRFKALADSMGVSPLTVVATAAVREAQDGEEFRQEVLAETGLKIWVIDGEEEARLSAQGVLLGWPGAYGLVCDIGGSSLELAEIRDGRVGRRQTSPLGPLKLREVRGGKAGRKVHIKATLEAMQEKMGPQRDRLFLVGGSWRAIARIDMERRNYPLHVLHEYRMDAKAIRDTVSFIEEADLGALRQACSLSEARMALVPLAAEVLKRLVSTFRPKDIAISSYGIREGMLYEQMPQKLRDRDPLIESAHFAEAKDARLPGFGMVLNDFVLPLFRSSPEELKRLIRASCLLHDVSWRAHPDYRAEVTFDYATRANLGGLKHWERIFLGLALLHRYRNKREGSPYERLFALLPEDRQQKAEILGKAMRLGSMFWMQAEARGAELRWFPKKRELELRLTPDAAPLFGEVVEARLKSLSTALSAASTRVVYLKA
ncbi:exopolyphosphatase / guanosine-5'-triphosphate,3'-diphosphate pyrophosphatase [Poseidonocella pacifica]|uniref:Exopolyphosphatase / guanosine-5'-triphosphate,3'-diphosphate pyrophosphatase n=1 Tax=Poseidonocella pacifica TaxID=871651 RepID=A0A1I0W9B7_9RHOB|nr:Ppx/GppA family phosphatase [Poseidonocella pacifica]SFA85319.1 exopolyphosphatase / guanosine-5'-triphosphate,3'-diphosphate pyrophosphatase [Poseidonocella pacifica]